MTKPCTSIPAPVLRGATIASLAAIAAWFAACNGLSDAWRTPGSPELYVTGVLGALLLLVPAAFAFAKRSRLGNASGSPVRSPHRTAA